MVLVSGLGHVFDSMAPQLKHIRLITGSLSFQRAVVIYTKMGQTVGELACFILLMCINKHSLFGVRACSASSFISENVVVSLFAHSQIATDSNSNTKVVSLSSWFLAALYSKSTSVHLPPERSHTISQTCDMCCEIKPRQRLKNEGLLLQAS